MKMTYDYMAKLHNFLYSSNNSDIDTLKSKADTHLKYIPHKKLYRYRQCNARELETLKSNSIWLSDPQKFPDMFDATIPMADRNYLYFDYTFLIFYRALLNTCEDGEVLPSKEELREIMYETMIKYTQKDME